MPQNSNRTQTRAVCLEARITAADLGPVRASVERWLHQASAAPSDGGMFHADGATFHLHTAGDGVLSVFLHAAGEGAGQTVAWHGCDLVGALAQGGGVAGLAWINHPQVPDLTPVRPR